MAVATFDLAENLVLETDRVLLRKLQRTDLPWLIEFGMTEPETWAFSLMSAAGTDGMRAYVESALADAERRYAFPFVVFDKVAQQYAGSTRFYDLQPQQQTLQVGFTWYGCRFRGGGINAHCKWLMLRHAFEHLQVERVEFRADHKNHRSIAAMKKLGCVEEGVLRSHLNTDYGVRRSSLVLSILRNEWFDVVKPRLVETIKNPKCD